MKIEAVTVSVDYSKWLSKCVTNADKFDKWVVVTHRSDVDTQNLCKKHEIGCVLSDRVFEDGAPFAKGRAINDGLSYLDRDAWLVHTDGDICLPDNFREIVEEQCVDTEKLYGAIRYTISGERMVGQTFAVVKRNEKTGKSTKTIQRYDIPIGYFQMWHSSKISKYLEASETGKQDDWKFAMLFRPPMVDKIVSHYMSGFVMLPLELTDVSGFQGHELDHWKGLRNIGKVKRKDT
tara:strand:+ start:93077 stop:93781 length:705 start_codon:yes stop_codon:yes gene_type:complete